VGRAVTTTAYRAIVGPARFRIHVKSAGDGGVRYPWRSVDFRRAGGDVAAHGARGGRGAFGARSSAGSPAWPFRSAGGGLLTGGGTTRAVAAAERRQSATWRSFAA